MKFELNTTYHVYNQGNNQRIIFPQERNYYFFLEKMKKHISPYAEFLAYCLMPNHFHWLIYTKPLACLPSKVLKPGYPSSLVEELNNYKIKGDEFFFQNLTNNISILLRSYTRAINKQENWSGSLFRTETKCKNGIVDGLITIDGKNKNLFFKPDNHYSKICFEYIHKNPVKANLAKNEVDWKFSSAREYQSNSKIKLCNIDLAKQLDLY